MIILLVFAVVGVGGLQVVSFMLQQHADTIHEHLLSLQQQQAQNSSTDISATTSTLNDTIKTLRSTLGTPQSWSANAAVVLRALPTGTTLSQLTIGPGRAFHVVGIADTRQTFLSLDSALQNPDVFSNVRTSSTASKRQSVPFDYQGTIISTAS